MNLEICENGCKDKEVIILDTRLPYFYSKVQTMFNDEPESVKVILIKDKQEFIAVKGEETEDCAFCKDNVIYIYEPSKFGVDCEVERKHFYEALCQELIYLFYLKNKN